ncbi:ribonuclease III [Parasphaerochaeta coccoides]|uniref:Ribonuclease 3 n=1 Tax=Parasphaerochaeta coccoides (strain ATCC BAA-1237 / DSM 17374 / SPN1) TaxID=760011 RepID=F4GJA8_PARC1|nr:ribonuclease III [Parasphaerochaeta coccoides]AEC01748.1 RNAse III [Parasphaerochaeta coccoides DSM 17374]
MKIALSRKMDFGKAPPVSPERKRELLYFQKNAGIKFHSLELLNLAFTHRSFFNESRHEVDNNERLEFLGDSVLGFMVSEWLFLNLPARHEGDFSKIRSYVVNEDSLAEIALSLHVDRFLIIGKGEEMNGGRTKKTILADCMEAIFAAYYLDAGLKPVQELILRHLVPAIMVVLDDRHKKDYKTLLQEIIQKRYHKYPVYELLRTSGPEHDRTFWVQVNVVGNIFGPASGANKKEAEQNAACAAYEALTGHHNKDTE